MLPVRCFTCNKVVGDLWERFTDLQFRVGGKEALDRCNLRRMCCRRMLLVHSPVIDDIVDYSRVDRTLDSCGTSMRSEVAGEREVACA